MTTKKTPHKHAEIIKLWADGERIQLRLDSRGEWRDIISDRPLFLENYEFRVKPSSWYRVALLNIDGALIATTTADSAEEELEIESEDHDFVRWLTDRIEYDPEN